MEEEEINVKKLVGKIRASNNLRGNIEPSAPRTTQDYNELSNKPQINDVELIGNKSLEDLNIQEMLVSGENIKTINNIPILGSGNINISGGEGSNVEIIDATHIETDTEWKGITTKTLSEFTDGTIFIYHLQDALGTPSNNIYLNLTTADNQVIRGLIYYKFPLTPLIPNTNFNRYTYITMIKRNSTSFICLTYNNLEATQEHGGLMSALDKTKLDDIDTSGFASADRGVEYIVGTQTVTTSSWLGVTQDSELYEGKMIAYFLPRASGTSGVTLGLTLPDSTTVNKSVYASNGAQLTNQYTQGSILFMIFRSNVWYCLADLNTQDFYHTKINASIKAGTNGIHVQSFCALDNNGNYQSFTVTGGTGTSKVVNTAKFQNPMIIYQSPEKTADKPYNTNLANPYSSGIVSLAYSTNNASSMIANTPVYIECTKTSDGYLQLTNNIMKQSGFTQGNYYVYLGNTGSTASDCAFGEQHPTYYYDGTNLVSETTGDIGNIASVLDAINGEVI